MKEAYSGGDATKSYGRANDFNVIFKHGKSYGDTRVIKLNKETVLEKNIVVVPDKDVFEFVFCIEGSLIFKLGDEEKIIGSEDLIIIDHNKMEENYSYRGIDRSKLVVGTFICER